MQTPELQKKTVKPQESLTSKSTPAREQKTRGHRRMSSVGQGALLTDIMHVSVDQDDSELPPPGMERKVIGKHKHSLEFARLFLYLNLRRLQDLEINLA